MLLQSRLILTRLFFQTLFFLNQVFLEQFTRCQKEWFDRWISINCSIHERENSCRIHAVFDCSIHGRANESKLMDDLQKTIKSCNCIISLTQNAALLTNCALFLMDRHPFHLLMKVHLIWFSAVLDKNIFYYYCSRITCFGYLIQRSAPDCITVFFESIFDWWNNL